MNKDLERLVERCVAAELDAPPGERIETDADRAFTALFSVVDPPVVPSDFAARTVRAARLEPLPPGRRALVSRWARGAQVSAGSMALLLGSIVAALVFRPLILVVVPSLFLLTVEAGLWWLQAIKSGIDVWLWSAGMSRVLATVALTSEGTIALTLTALIGLCAVMGFERLVRSGRESSPC